MESDPTLPNNKGDHEHLQQMEKEQQSIQEQEEQLDQGTTTLAAEGPRTPFNAAAQVGDDRLDDADDELVDDTLDFILNPDDVEEVQIDDDAEPMDEDDDDDDDENEADALGNRVVDDMSKAQVHVHTGHVYAVASYYSAPTSSLTLLSGGGDDKAFWHQWTVPPVPLQNETTPIIPTVSPSVTSVQLSHAHTDSVSCVAINLPYLQASSPQEATSPSTTRYLAVGAYDGAIIIYDADTQAKIQEFEGPSDVEWLAFHPKGGTVILAGSAADGTIWMFHIPLRKCLQVFVGHESAVTAGAFSPDGRWALSTSSDGTARIWAPRTGQCKHVFRFTSAANSNNDAAGLTCLATNGGPDGQCIMVGSEDGMAYVCHIGTKKVVASLRHYEIPSAAATSMSEDNDDDDGMELPMSVEAVGFCSQNVNPNWCATGGADGVLKIWDLSNDGQCRQTCRSVAAAAGNAPSSSSPTRGGLTCLRWHTSLPLVFTASSSGVVELWDARSGRLLQSLTGHTDVINDMDIQFVDAEGFPGARAIVTTGSEDKTIRIFQVNVQAALQQQQ